MIKSAHLTESVSRRAGGLFEAVLRLVQAQAAGEMTVKVFGLRDEFSEADLSAWSPVAVEAFATTWPAAIGRSPEFWKSLLAFQPDIVHTHGLWRYPSIAALHYRRKTQRPYLISPHGMLDPWALQNSRWKKRIAGVWFEKAHLRGAHCLRALCASEAHSIRQLRLGNPIAVIPNGITLPETLPGQSQKLAAPWAGWVEPGEKVLLFLSRIHPKKGLVNLLKAWAELPKAGRAGQGTVGWSLAIAGWDQGGHEAELKQLCRELQLPFADLRDKASKPCPPSAILFLGPQFNEAKSACYQHCDAFVLPSFSEGLPMVVLEAWANAKPVLMTSECNLPEGFLAGAAIKAETNTGSLVAGLNELIRMNETDREVMGARARRLVEERFTWQRVGDQIREVYQWILGGGSKPSCLEDA